MLKYGMKEEQNKGSRSRFRNCSIGLISESVSASCLVKTGNVDLPTLSLGRLTLASTEVTGGGFGPLGGKDYLDLEGVAQRGLPNSNSFLVNSADWSTLSEEVSLLW